MLKALINNILTCTNELPHQVHLNMMFLQQHNILKECQVDLPTMCHYYIAELTSRVTGQVFKFI